MRTAYGTAPRVAGLFQQPPMADASLNRRMTVLLGDAVAFAQIGIVGLDGQIELEALRLYGLPQAAPALLCALVTLWAPGLGVPPCCFLRCARLPARARLCQHDSGRAAPPVLEDPCRARRRRRRKHLRP